MAMPPPGGLSEASAFKIILCPSKMTAAKSQRAQSRLGQTGAPPPASLPLRALSSFPDLPTSRTRHNLTPVCL